MPNFPKTELGQLLFAKLQTLYAEQQRHYHNLKHINNLLQLFSQYEDKIADKEAIFWTIWFHDCVYFPQKSDNEEQSAIVAKIELQKIANEISIDTKFIDKVIAFILATKTHTNPTKDSDLQWFLDFDLSVLGADAVIYDEYAQNIRKEYAHIPTWKYSIGRRKILAYFLEKDKIFQFLPESYEKQARENLQREQKKLKWKLW
jgi:predicted metal-dependent HD superfamily phosphohydrolase